VVYRDDFGGVAAESAKDATVPEIAPGGFLDAGSHTGLDGNGHLIANMVGANVNYRFRMANAPVTESSASAIKYKAVFKAPTNDWIGIGFSQYNKNGLSVAESDAGPWVQYGADGVVVIYGGSALSGSSASFDAGYAPGDVVEAEMTYRMGARTVALDINGKHVAQAVPVSHVGAEGAEAGSVAGWAQIQFRNQTPAGASVDGFEVEIVP
jgi:hypothetical protein